MLVDKPVFVMGVRIGKALGQAIENSVWTCCRYGCWFCTSLLMRLVMLHAALAYERWKRSLFVSLFVFATL